MITYVIRLSNAETSNHRYDQLAKGLSENVLPAEVMRYEFL